MKRRARKAPAASVGWDPAIVLRAILELRRQDAISGLVYLIGSGMTFHVDLPLSTPCAGCGEPYGKHGGVPWTCPKYLPRRKVKR